MMDVTKTNRDIKTLKTPAQTAVKLLFQECYKNGIRNIFITETYRSQARQNYLYAQGRTRPGKVVTWTLKSNHTPGYAWDIACSSPLSLYDDKTLNKVGQIASKLGITWGGNWKNNIDKPHFEVSANWKIPKGYLLENNHTVPIDSKQKIEVIKKVGKYEVVQDKVNNVWRIQSGTFKTKEDAIKAFEKSGLTYATIRGSAK